MGKTIVIKSDTGRSYDIFIYCNWVSTQLQWSVDLHKNKKIKKNNKKKQTARKEKQLKNSTKCKTKNKHT